MKIFCLRHGQTNYNLQGLCNSDPTRDVHLSDMGIQQARQAAAQLREEPLDLILVSELPRTRQTAEIVNRFHAVPIQTHAAINDIRSGFEGRPVSEYQSAIASDPMHSKCNGGESLLEHKQRVLGFIPWLQAQDLDTVLVVAHEETLRVLAAWFQQLPDETMIGLHFNNCELLEFTLT